MKVLAAGGGSGGHVTPVLAVINALAREHDEPASQIEVRFICDQAFADQSRGLAKHANVPIDVSVIMAGKFRRYHGESLLRRVGDIRTNLLNLRDIFFIGIGIIQALVIIYRFKPDVVFAKGGYVCLPVGIAAKLFRVPIVIHDSDVRPGLTNKMLSRFATKIATGAPTKYYGYPQDRTVHTGVPIDESFQPVSEERQAELKEAYGVASSRPLVVVTGGGLGAKSINRATVKAASKLTDSGASIIHVTGKRHYEDVLRAAVKSPHYIITPFIYNNMADLLGAADVVVSRASATFLQELAGLKKPVIAVPAGHLGDQQKNAEVFSKADAALVLQDNEIVRGDHYENSIRTLLDDKDRRENLSLHLHAFAKPHAAHDVARMILEVAKEHSSHG